MTTPTFSHTGQPTAAATTDTSATELPRAPCGTCGFASILDDAGLVIAHFQERVRTGADGKPERYTTATPCDGAGEEPETSN